MSENSGSIDWEEVRRRLADSQRALDRALAVSEENLETVYRERAVQLARRGIQKEVSATALRVLVFALGPERYALEFAALKELLPFAGCSPVPGGPPQLLGVINVHGEIRSVVDLGQLLDLPGRDTVADGYVLLLGKQDRRVGLRVDRLDKIQLLAPGELAVPPDTEGGPALHLLKALGPDRLRLLNIEALWAHPIFGAAT